MHSTSDYEQDTVTLFGAKGAAVRVLDPNGRATAVVEIHEDVMLTGRQYRAFKRAAKQAKQICAAAFDATKPGGH